MKLRFQRVSVERLIPSFAAIWLIVHPLVAISATASSLKSFVITEHLFLFIRFLLLYYMSTENHSILSGKIHVVSPKQVGDFGMIHLTLVFIASALSS